MPELCVCFARSDSLVHMLEVHIAPCPAPSFFYSIYSSIGRECAARAITALLICSCHKLPAITIFSSVISLPCFVFRISCSSRDLIVLSLLIVCYRQEARVRSYMSGRRINHWERQQVRLCSFARLFVPSFCTMSICNAPSYFLLRPKCPRAFLPFLI